MNLDKQIARLKGLDFRVKHISGEVFASYGVKPDYKNGAAPVKGHPCFILYSPTTDKEQAMDLLIELIVDLGYRDAMFLVDDFFDCAEKLGVAICLAWIAWKEGQPIRGNEYER